jgi:hypothetical protein
MHTAAIHPFIAENLPGILSSRISTTPPPTCSARLVALDRTRHCQPLEATNSQMIRSPNAILEIRLLTHLCFTRDESNNNDGVSNNANDSQQRRRRRRVDISSCPVCLYRIDPLRLGMPVPPNHHLCSKFCPPPNLVITDVARQLARGDAAAAAAAGNADYCPRQRFLQPWRHLALCRVSDNSNVLERTESATTNHPISLLLCRKNTVGLTCGFGLWSVLNKHAADHFVESQHPIR